MTKLQYTRGWRVRGHPSYGMITKMEWHLLRLILLFRPPVAWLSKMASTQTGMPERALCFYENWLSYGKIVFSSGLCIFYLIFQNPYSSSFYNLYWHPHSEMAARLSASTNVPRQTNSHFFNTWVCWPYHRLARKTKYNNMDSTASWSQMNTYTDDDDNDDNEHSTQTSYTQVNH